MVGLETGKWSESSPADIGRSFRSSSTARRVGSDRALNTAFIGRYLAKYRIDVQRRRGARPKEEARSRSGPAPQRRRRRGSALGERVVVELVHVGVELLQGVLVQI